MEDEGGDTEGVVIPPEFQQATHSLMKQAKTKHHLSHVRSMISDKEDAMREAESGKANKLSAFSGSEMPKD